MRNIFHKIPWGILAGISGILTFYLIIGVYGAYFVFAQVNAQTGQIATIFDSWWQILLFIFAVLFAVIFVLTLTLFILKKIMNKKGAITYEEKSK